MPLHSVPVEPEGEIGEKHEDGGQADEGLDESPPEPVSGRHRPSTHRDAMGGHQQGR